MSAARNVVAINTRAATALREREEAPPPATSLVRSDLKNLLVQPVLELMIRTGVGVHFAAKYVFDQGRMGKLGVGWQLAAQEKGRVSPASLARWALEFKKAGPAGLVDKYQGRQRQMRGWETRAYTLYNRPSHPDCGDVADWLRQEGYEVTRPQVYAFISTLGADQSTHSRKRLGASYHANNVRLHAERDVSDLAPGEAWVSDGHKLKLISRGPGGVTHRLEVTPVLDIRTNYCFGAWFANAESGEDTVFSFGSAAMRNNGLPVFFYSDNGPGFANARTAAMFNKAGVTHLKARPGMCSSKGFGEGFMHVINKKFSKQFETYCGDDRTDDVISRLKTKERQGAIRIPNDEEVRQAFWQWIEHYNKSPQPYSKRLAGKAPADFAAEMKLQPLNMPIEQLLRPEVAVTVFQSTVKFERRTYHAAELYKFAGERVLVQYDAYDESQVWVYDQEARFITAATLLQKVPFMQPSVAEDGRAKAELAAIRRKQNAIEEIRARNRGDIEGALGSAGTAYMLAQGHSFALPPRAAPEPHAIAALELVDADTEREVHALFAAAPAPAETPEQRFSRWLALRDTQASPADAAWAESYAESAECGGFLETYEAFGYLPGVTTEQQKGPASTGPLTSTAALPENSL